MRTPITVAALAAALTVATAGCGGGSSGQEAAAPSSAPPSAAELGRAVVAVQGDYGSKKPTATGVIYAADQGLVLTANHAMENAPKINVWLSDGTLTHARQVVRAQCHDLAVLQLIQRRGLTQMPFGDSDRVGVGQPVRTLTYLFPASPSKTEWPALTQVTGAITTVGTSAKFPPLPTMGSLIAHQTPLLASASGSPVVDASGRMIGINTFVDHPSTPSVPGVEFALSSNYIRGRLRELDPGSEGTPVGWRSEHDRCHKALHGLLAKGHIHAPNKAGSQVPKEASPTASPEGGATP